MNLLYETTMAWGKFLDHASLQRIAALEAKIARLEGGTNDASPA